MPLLPLLKRLKKKVHRDTALAQDIIVSDLYSHFPDAVIHGGTAIWRCYGSNRFSEDIDVWLSPRYSGKDRITSFVAALKVRGLAVARLKQTARAIFASFQYAGITVRFEAAFAPVREAVVRPFELADGIYINVRTLPPDRLLEEKVSAYISRRKVRDLYDIWFLLRHIEDRSRAREALAMLLRNWHEPVDAAELPVLIITGAIPRLVDMVEEVRRWVK